LWAGAILLSAKSALPRLPGHIVIRRDDVTVYIPLGLMIALSVIGSLVLSLQRRLWAPRGTSGSTCCSSAAVESAPRSTSARSVVKNAPAPRAIATTLVRDIDDDSPAAPPRVTVAGKVVPAHGHTVAGDFWDVCEDSDGSRVVVVGDVVGHGARAKPVADELRALIRATAAETNDPSRLLSAANSRIARRHDSTCIATALVMRLDPRLHEIVWASAGHPSPYWLDDGLQLVPSAPGVPLGIDHGVIYGADRVPFGRRTGVLLYTDGVLDAKGPGGARFGRERLGRLLRLLRDCSAPYTAAEVMRCVCHFACHQLPDDAAAVAVRWGPPARAGA
jgi:stage II sporulation SpoE-like protein/DUF2905 family protein